MKESISDDRPTYRLCIISRGAHHSSRHKINVAFRARTLEGVLRFLQKHAHWKTEQRLNGRRWIDRDDQRATIYGQPRWQRGQRYMRW
jgi:hypothetical protein